MNAADEFVFVCFVVEPTVVETTTFASGEPSDASKTAPAAVPVCEVVTAIVFGVIAFDAQAQTVTVEPGVVLDQLNAWLSRHGLWFPVDVSTSAQP